MATNKILAIDPGIHCGWAFGKPGMTVSNVWELKSKRLEGAGMRYYRFRKFLEEFEASSADLVVFEEVRRHAGMAAAHVYGGIVAVLMAYCEEFNINYCSVPIGTWKKAVVGKGSASKEEILAYVQKNLFASCDNYDQADALCILEWAKKEYGEDSIYS